MNATASRFFLVALNIFVAAWSLSLDATEIRSPSNFVIEGFRQGLADNGVPPRIVETIKQDADVKALVRRNLSSRLLNGLLGASGKDFRIEPAKESIVLHTGVLMMRYSSNAVAERMMVLLRPLRGYFMGSKILVRFAAVPVGEYLVVIYSESSGDERIVELLKQLPERFQHASHAAPVWTEPVGK